jgi:hypothetical protein
MPVSYQGGSGRVECHANVFGGAAIPLHVRHLVAAIAEADADVSGAPNHRAGPLVIQFKMAKSRCEGGAP